MSYDIQCRNNMLTGAELIVSVPEHEVDTKALYTIQADLPPFLLPFRHVSIDGKAQFIYQIGLYCKLQYLTGDRDVKEYAQLWTSILSPLLDCKDWFMHPNAFLLDAQYMYFDKDKNMARYVYIPSIQSISNHNSLKELAADVSRFVTVDDAQLENKVLRAIMKNFDPNELLTTLRSNMSACAEQAPNRSSLYDEGSPILDSSLSIVQSIPPITEQTGMLPPQEEPDSKPQDNSSFDPSFDPGDIVIKLPEKSAGKDRAKNAGEGKKAQSGKKSQEKDKRMSGLFGRKKELSPPATPYIPQNISAPGAAVAERSSVYLNADSCSEARAPEYVHSSSASNIVIHSQISHTTESIVIEACGPKLRYVGHGRLPLIIEVCIEDGGIFSIGRYDAAVGKQQSSFEFDRKTKAVSRRHAVIERNADNYSIIDLASSAGTFIDGERLPPNTAADLISGAKISLGNSGADYIWEMP